MKDKSTFVVHKQFTVWGDFVVLAGSQAEAETIVDNACDVREKLIETHPRPIIQWEVMVAPADPSQKPREADLAAQAWQSQLRNWPS